jgi:hypothetical protein
MFRIRAILPIRSALPVRAPIGYRRNRLGRELRGLAVLESIKGAIPK